MSVELLPEIKQTGVQPLIAASSKETHVDLRLLWHILLPDLIKPLPTRGAFPSSPKGELTMKPLAVLCAATIAAALTACNQQPSGNQSSGSHAADLAAVKATEAQWNQDWATHDLEKITAHYADDAVLIVPGAAAVVGRTAIHDGMKTMASDPATSLKFSATKVEVARSGDIAWTEGDYTLTLNDPQTKKTIDDHGSYVTTYRKQPDGTWKAVVDIATSTVPPTAPAAVPASK